VASISACAALGVAGGKYLVLWKALHGRLSNHLLGEGIGRGFCVLTMSRTILASTAMSCSVVSACRLFINIASCALGIRVIGCVSECLSDRLHGLASLTAMVTGK